MRKIGTVTPIWNQELFIKPHFEMLSQLDRNIVLMQPGPLPQYATEHGYSRKPDLSRNIIESYFPKVEIYEGNFPTTIDYSAALYNEGLAYMDDCDIVLRLDPDMLWTKKDWESFVKLLRTTDFDCYRMDFPHDSINYYMTGDFEHGLKDAQESDPLAVDPHKQFTGVLDYHGDKETTIKIPGWVCHHFRGWQKPKSTPPDWYKTRVPDGWVGLYGNNGKWFKCDPEVRKTMETWMQELDDMKEDEE